MPYSSSHVEIDLGPCQICGALRDLVPFVQLKKREKDPWRSVPFQLY